ncbi:MAG: hemerythrin domain-containing protein, partial [Deltaproteobacteria bacterium]|nr:hemerythrin domain-containing protein [Deltaproteobacteria bacterium]
PHMKGEEKAFYARLASQEGAKEHALEGFEEHHAAELVLTELKKTSPSDERFHAKVTVLHEMIEHHIQEEEKELFKDARRFMTKDQIAEILEQFTKEKERVKKGLAPN